MYSHNIDQRIKPLHKSDLVCLSVCSWVKISRSFFFWWSKRSDEFNIFQLIWINWIKLGQDFYTWTGYEPYTRHSWLCPFNLHMTGNLEETICERTNTNLSVLYLYYICTRTLTNIEEVTLSLTLNLFVRIVSTGEIGLLSSPNYIDYVREDIYWRDFDVSFRESFNFFVTSPMCDHSIYQQPTINIYIYC